MKYIASAALGLLLLLSCNTRYDERSNGEDISVPYPKDHPVNPINDTTPIEKTTGDTT